MTTRKNESCYKEAKAIDDSITRLIRLETDRLNGIPTDKELEFEHDVFIANEFRFVRCILKETKEE